MMVIPRNRDARMAMRASVIVRVGEDTILRLEMEPHLTAMIPNPLLEEADRRRHRRIRRVDSRRVDRNSRSLNGMG
jgi:hypothetical protein